LLPIAESLNHSLRLEIAPSFEFAQGIIKERLQTIWMVVVENIFQILEIQVGSGVTCTKNRWFQIQKLFLAYGHLKGY
jgi:hypothetical protein